MKRSVFKWLVLVWLAGLQSLAAQDIQEAAAAGDLEKVRALLQADPALVNQRSLGTTPLHEAARSGQLEMVKLLLAGGALVNAKDSSGLTPLKLALGHGRTQVAAWLREHGGLETAPAAPQARTNAPVAPAVSTGPKAPATNATRPAPEPRLTNPQAPASATAPRLPAQPAGSEPTRLKPGAAKPVPLNPVIFPIHQAAEVGDTEQVTALLRDWPELLEAQNERGLTPLHVAAGNAKKETAEALLARRADVQAKTKYGWLPIHFAATRGDPATVALLLAYGAKVNVKTRTDETPLHMAARGGHLEAARLLLAHRADPNVVEKTTGSTPLHLAVSRGGQPLVELFLAAGGDVNAADEAGETPLSLALASGYDAIAELLKQQGGREPQGRPLTALEQSLVDFYRKLDQTFRTGSTSEKRKAALAMMPTRSDAQKLFPKHSAEAIKVVDEMNREMRSTPDKDLGLPANDPEIWKLQPGPPTPYIGYCQSKGLIASNVPIYRLVVKKKGRKTLVDMYCFVNDHWVPLPPLARILPE